MKNRQHEYILKAFLESKIPTTIRRHLVSLMPLDSVIGGYCAQILQGEKNIKKQSKEIITSSQRNSFLQLIDQLTGVEKEDLEVYYQLLILVEKVLNMYLK